MAARLEVYEYSCLVCLHSACLHFTKNMARFSDSEIEVMIELYGEEVLWNVPHRDYMNADLHKAALQRISRQLRGADIGKLVFLTP
jgi:hypothetical protein